MSNCVSLVPPTAKEDLFDVHISSPQVSFVGIGSLNVPPIPSNKYVIGPTPIPGISRQPSLNMNEQKISPFHEKLNH